MRLHYLEKLKIRVFCENSNAEKAKLGKFYLGLFTTIVVRFTK